MKGFARLIAVALAASIPAAHAATVFSDDFDGAIPSQINGGSAAIEGVQSYTGLGPVGNQFGGSFLRSAGGNTVTLTLTGLGAHSTISMGFLFAAIDSLDGGLVYPGGDFFVVSLDGNTLFAESFENSVYASPQSYVPTNPAFVLARHADLGFTPIDTYYSDSAYNLGAEGVFQNVAHTASTAVFTFLLNGNQGLEDESWAIENLTISTNGTVPLPAAAWMLLSGLGGIGALARRRKQQRD